MQDVNLAGRGFGGLPIAYRASWEDEPVGLLGMRHDDAKPNNYCTAVGAFCLLHEGPMSYPPILCGHRWIVWGYQAAALMGSAPASRRVSLLMSRILHSPRQFGAKMRNIEPFGLPFISSPVALLMKFTRPLRHLPCWSW